MKKIKSILLAIYWFFYRLTPKGKEAYMMHKAFAGIQKYKKDQNITKFNVIGFANRLLKPKKIITFHKGKSITKSKQSDHQVIEASKTKHSDELKNRSLKISKSGKFKHA